SGIKIAPAGKVIINNATLTSLAGCNDPAMWNGIMMESNITVNQTIVAAFSQPQVVLNSAKIFNARRGVLTGLNNSQWSGGGVVKATNSLFKNNYIDVEF